jgi:hypothetical protein
MVIAAVIAIACGAAMIRLARRSPKAAAAAVIAAGIVAAMVSAAPTKAMSPGCFTTTTTSTTIASGVGAGSPTTTTRPTTTTTTIPPCEPAALPALAWEAVSYDPDNNEFFGYDFTTDEALFRIALTQASSDALDAFVATATTPSPTFAFGATGTATFSVQSRVTLKGYYLVDPDTEEYASIDFIGSASSSAPFGPTSFSLEPDDTFVVRVRYEDVSSVENEAYNDALQKLAQFETDNNIDLNGGETSTLTTLGFAITFSPATVFDGCDTTQPSLSAAVNVDIESSASASDARTKRDIVPVVLLDNGLQLHSFRYLWDDSTVYVGVIAQELIGTRFEHAVHSGRNGILAVDYAALGLRMVTLEEYLSDPTSVFAESTKHRS